MPRWPWMNPRPSRSWATVSPAAAPASPAAGSRSGGGEAGRVKQKSAARKYRPPTMRISASAPATLTTSGPEQGEPEREGRVEREREDAVRGQQQLPLDDGRDHRRFGWREERGQGRDEDVEDQDRDQVRPGEVQPDERDAPQEVRRDQDDPPIEAVDVDAGDRREQHGRHEERQEQQADRRVRRRRVDDDDGQAVQDHVAADLGRGLRGPEAKERRVAEDGRGARGLRLEDRLGADGSAGSRSRSVTGGERIDGGGQGRVTVAHEPGEASLDACRAAAARAARSSGSEGRGRRRADPRATYRRHTGAAG